MFQMFHLNRIKYLISILLCICFLPSVSAIVKPTNKFYINDYANILSNETEEYILNKSIQLNNADGTQIVVVTVPNLEGMTLESYANQLFNEFGIGDKEKNNGLLLLLALEERQFRVEVGYGLEGILPDGKTGRFQDQYIIPYLKNNKWDDGVKNGYDAFYKEIVTLNNVDIKYTEPIQNSSNTYNPFFPFFLGLILGWLLNLLKDKTNFIMFYLGIAFIFILLFSDFKVTVLQHLVGFVLGCSGWIPGVGSSFSSRYRSGFSGSGGRSSGGGFSGGGGRSGGGGSSRGF